MAVFFFVDFGAVFFVAVFLVVFFDEAFVVFVERVEGLRVRCASYGSAVALLLLLLAFVECAHCAELVERVALNFLVNTVLQRW